MKKHKFSSTNVELHTDGSATVHHVHESNPAKDVKHAVGSIDEIHDSFEKHLNPKQIESEVESRGQDPEQLEEQVSPGIHDRILELSGKDN